MSANEDEKKKKGFLLDIRDLCENWFLDNVFCPNCGYEKLNKTPSSASTFCCSACQNKFLLTYREEKDESQLSVELPFSYNKIISQIESALIPDTFVLFFNEYCDVTRLFLVHKKFITTDAIIQKGNVPFLALDKILGLGIIRFFQYEEDLDGSEILAAYQNAKLAEEESAEFNGWVKDVYLCIVKIGKEEFELNDVYRYVDYLKQKHVNNNTIEAKIRQQLQVLRKRGYLEFLGHGRFRRLR